MIWVLRCRGPVTWAPGLTGWPRSRRGTRRGGGSTSGRVALVAAERGAVQETVVAHHELQPAGGRGIGQVDGSALDRVGAQHRRLGQIGRWLGPALPRELPTAETLPRVTECLQERGVSDADIEKILGANFLRAFEAIETSRRG